jgi:hypothetical protein
MDTNNGYKQWIQTMDINSGNAETRHPKMVNVKCKIQQKIISANYNMRFGDIHNVSRCNLLHLCRIRFGCLHVICYFYVGISISSSSTGIIYIPLLSLAMQITI